MSTFKKLHPSTKTIIKTAAALAVTVVVAGTVAVLNSEKRVQA